MTGFQSKPTAVKKPKAKAKPSVKNSPMLKKLAALATQGQPSAAPAGAGYQPQWPTGQ